MASRIRTRVKYHHSNNLLLCPGAKVGSSSWQEACSTTVAPAQKESPAHRSAMSTQASFPKSATLNGAQGSSLEKWLAVPGQGQATQALYRMVAEIAATDIPILLLGEGGTGKEVLAHQIHLLSAQQAQALVKINCASMRPESVPDTLLRDDPFNGNGEAEGSTIFFDEVSDLDAASQRYLLSILPDGDAMPRARTLRARIISATSRNLEEEVKNGRFRSELYYRINGFCLRVPPLRQRKEDIPALTDFFLAKYAATFGRPRPTLSENAANVLLEYPWPGNIRELENTVRKIVAVGDEQIALADLAAAPARPWSKEPQSKECSLKAAARAASRQAERELILEALARTRWNRKRAAQQLQISYKSLLLKLRQIGTEEPEAT
jgi:two-component system, NtrC family, response regulator AtoC